MPRLPFRALSALVACALVLPAVPARAGSPVTRVGPGFFLTLTAGLANAFSASKVIVEAGTYHECPTVTGLVLLTIVFKKGAVLDATGCDAGITIKDGAGITLKNVTIVGAKRGVVVKAAAERVLVTKSTIRDAQTDPQLSVLETGVEIEGASDVTLDGVTIRGAATQAVRALLTAGMTVRKSTLADGLGNGVAFVLGSGAAVEKNVMTGLGGLAVLGSASDSLVASNRIFASGGGIALGGTNNLVEKNKLTDLATASIEAPNGRGGSFYRKNTIVRPAIAAIVAAGSVDTFEKNTVKEPLATGIDVAGSDNAFLGGKVSAAVDVGIAIRAGANRNRFEGTSSAKAGSDGFRVQGQSNVFVKAKASGSGALDLNDAAGPGTTNVYTDCKFKTSNVN